MEDEIKDVPTSEENETEVLDTDTSNEDLAKQTELASNYKIRAEKAEAKLKDFKNMEKETPTQPETAHSTDGSVSREDYDNLQMTVLGYKSKEEKDVIRTAAKSLGVSIEEAGNNEFVTAKIEKMREEAKTAKATPTSSKGSKVKDTKGVDYYIDNKIMPDDDEMYEKVSAELRDRSRGSVSIRRN